MSEEITNAGTKEEKVHLAVELDFDRLDLDDLLLIEDFQSGREINPIQMAGFLDRIIVGGIRGKHYRPEAMESLFEGVNAAFEARMNPVAVQEKPEPPESEPATNS